MKKHSTLYTPLVERIYKEKEKAAKTHLHQIHGAYVQPNALKKAEKHLNELAANPHQNEIIKSILKLHASTNERLNFYPAFFEYVFNAINKNAGV